MGSAIGTPAFMSPEQASGTLEALGPATDVYSLGATLYALLTNRPPFEGPVGEVLQKVEHGSWTPPRAVNASVPTGLDAICRKAMALRPEDRYATPLELAEDVEHWLADDPVTAYAEPITVRLRRWLRKHPKRVTAVVAFLAASVVGLTIGAVFIDEQRQAAEDNFERAEREHQAADRMWHLANSAVDTYFRKVTEDPALDQGELGPLRQKLLASAMTYYHQFIRERSDDSGVRRELAAAYRRAGVHSETNAENQRLLDAALERYRAMLQESPRDRELRSGLAQTYLSLAGFYFFGSGEKQRNVEAARQGIELLEDLWAEEKELDVGLLLGDAYSERAFVNYCLGHFEARSNDIRRGVEVRREALRLWPKDERLPGRLCTAYRRSGRLDHCLQGVEMGRRMLDLQKPSLPMARYDLTKAIANVACTYVERMGRPASAEPLLREASKINHKNMREYARGTELQFVLNGWLGESLFLQGKTRAAAPLLVEVLSGKEAYVESGAGKFHFLDNRAWFRCLLGWLEGEGGDRTKGLAYCQAALKEHEALLAEYKENGALASDGLWNREAIARFRFLAKEIDREPWIAEQRRILEQRKKVAAAQPKERQFESEVAASSAVLAGILLEAGLAKEAIAAVDEVLPAHERLVAGDKIDNSELPQIDLRNYEYRRVLSELLSRKGEALARTRKLPDAIKAVRQAIEICDDISKQEPCYLYDLAHHLTLASTLPGMEGGSQFADRAIKALADFVASGFDNPYKLRHDPRLEPLAKREDFQKLVRDLEAKLKQASP